MSKVAVTQTSFDLVAPLRYVLSLSELEEAEQRELAATFRPFRNLKFGIFSNHYMRINRMSMQLGRGSCRKCGPKDEWRRHRRWMAKWRSFNHSWVGICASMALFNHRFHEVCLLAGILKVHGSDEKCSRLDGYAGNTLKPLLRKLGFRLFPSELDIDTVKRNQNMPVEYHIPRPKKVRSSEWQHHFPSC